LISKMTYRIAITKGRQVDAPRPELSWQSA
jgi:hypothetical protein